MCLVDKKKGNFEGNFTNFAVAKLICKFIFFSNNLETIYFTILASTFNK